jgi:hypothetical protein
MTDHLAALASASGVSRRVSETQASYRLRVIECVSVMPKARWLTLPLEVQDFYNREAERVNNEAQEAAEKAAANRPPAESAQTSRQRGAPSVTSRAYEIMCLDPDLTPPQVFELLTKEGFPRPSMSLLHTVRCQTKLMLRIMAANGRLKTA